MSNVNCHKDDLIQMNMIQVNKCDTNDTKEFFPMYGKFNCHKNEKR